MNIDCICINLRRASNAVTEYYDRALDSTGISVNQYSLLSHIVKIAPCTTSSLADEVMLERTTLTRNLKRLLEDGYICDLAESRARDHKYVLTEKGEAVLNQARPLWRQAQEDIRCNIGEKDLNQFMETLNRLQER